MSRHDIPAPDGLEVVVGGDPPLNTYFAQVWDRRLDEDDPESELLWIGCTPGEIRDSRQVLNAVAAWVAVPPGVHDALIRDAEGGAA